MCACLKCWVMKATPYSAAHFPILAFSSGVNCTCGPHPFTEHADFLVSVIFEIVFVTLVLHLNFPAM